MASYHSKPSASSSWTMSLATCAFWRPNLKTEGYAVSTATDGIQALEVFSAQPADLILLDIMMPRLDGFGVCQRIREFSNVPIMILTAKGDGA